MEVTIAELNQEGEVTVVQERIDIDVETPKVVGGVTYQFGPRETGVRVTFGGDPFSDPRVQEAVLHAVPWRELTEQVFPDEDVPVGVDLWQVGLVLDDAREVPFDPDRAWELLAEAGFAEGFRLHLLFSLEDEQLAIMAEIMAEVLSELGIIVEPLPLPAADAPAAMGELIAAGESVLWLAR
jgi:ABC-type transport system substrate-binding protein